MAKYLRFATNLLKINQSVPARSISIYPKLQLKEISKTENGKELVIEGTFVASPRSDYLVKVDEHKCSMCALNLQVKHTDVLILSQFVRSDGCMLPRRVTGLCLRQQRRMSAMVSMAQKSGLMPNLNPANSKKDPKKRYGYKKYNKYFYEETIKCK